MNGNRSILILTDADTGAFLGAYTNRILAAEVQAGTFSPSNLDEHPVNVRASHGGRRPVSQRRKYRVYLYDDRRRPKVLIENPDVPARKWTRTHGIFQVTVLGFDKGDAITRATEIRERSKDALGLGF
jgi:hypothetical protein